MPSYGYCNLCHEDDTPSRRCLCLRTDYGKPVKRPAGRPDRNEREGDRRYPR